MTPVTWPGEAAFGVAVTGSDGAPSTRALALVALTCTVYSVPGSSDWIVYVVVVPPVISCWRSVALNASLPDFHCTL